MSDVLWAAALDWQAYLEEVTAGIAGNAEARAVREELRAHLEEARAALVERGMCPGEAAAAALREMGEAGAARVALGRRPATGWLHRLGAGPARTAARWRRALLGWPGARRAGMAAAAAGLVIAALGWGLVVTSRQLAAARADARQAQAVAQRALDAAAVRRPAESPAAAAAAPVVLGSQSCHALPGATIDTWPAANCLVLFCHVADGQPAEAGLFGDGAGAAPEDASRTCSTLSIMAAATATPAGDS